MPVNLATSDDLEALERRISALELSDQMPANVAANTSGGRIAKANGISQQSKTKSVGPSWEAVVWGALAYDYFPHSFGDIGCFVRINTGGALNGNMVFSEPGIYNFKAQIYLEPPQSGANLSVYLGIFDLGYDGLGSGGDAGTAKHVVNMNNVGGMHPSLNMNIDLPIEIPPEGHRFMVFRWYFLDGAQIVSSATLQTEANYCFASVERKILFTTVG